MITADELVKELETGAVKIATNDVMEYLTVSVWSGFGWMIINPLVGYLVGIVASILMQKLDWVSYMVVENWETTNEGKAFAQAAEQLTHAQTGGNQDEIDAAEKAKEDAFRKLVSLGSP